MSDETWTHPDPERNKEIKAELAEIAAEWERRKAEIIAEYCLELMLHAARARDLKAQLEGDGE